LFLLWRRLTVAGLHDSIIENLILKLWFFAFDSIVRLAGGQSYIVGAKGKHTFLDGWFLDSLQEGLDPKLSFDV
jgi:hypothetical protein